MSGWVGAAPRGRPVYYALNAVRYTLVYICGSFFY
jgi:hypothetical protein